MDSRSRGNDYDSDYGDRRHNDDYDDRGYADDRDYGGRPDRVKGRSSKGKKATTKPYFLDRRILITGSSSGIGRCLAFWYLNNGARVALVGRDKDSLTKIAKEFPSQAIVIHCDLADDKQQYEMATGVIEKFGGLDILVNCAGAIFEGDVEKTFPQDFDYLCDINLRLPFHLITLFQPFLEKSGGCIVNLSCINGHKPAQGNISYCMSKAGLEMLTKSAALELAPFGVRVN
jgi:NAD(P)-dependent dehydrogenase (short-subunit alcohol dehydrogenase family)